MKARPEGSARRQSPANPLPRMRDVAAEAGVSLTTVSVVLGGVRDAGIPASTQERVRVAAKRLGYIPNASARSLRTMRSRALGFLANGIAASPFAGEVILGAQAEAWRRGYVLLIVDTGDIENTEETDLAVQILLEQRVEHVIVASLFHRAIEVPHRLKGHNPILVDCFSDTGQYDAIVPDEAGGGYLATSQLLKRHRAPVGIIRFPDYMPAGTGRFAGYRAALDEYGVPFEPAAIAITVSGEAREGYQRAAELLERNPKLRLLFCANDRTAMGAFEFLRRQGSRIPEDIAIVGFDNQTIIAEALIPQLTTIALPHYEMGVKAVEIILNSEEPEKVVRRGGLIRTVPCELIVRESA